MATPGVRLGTNVPKCHIHVILSFPQTHSTHSTHSAPPLDTLGALQYHSGDHPCFLSLCHPPDILVSNLHLNSSDLGTSGPQDLWTSGPLDLGTLLAPPDSCSCSSASTIQSLLIHSTFPSGTTVCTSFASLLGISHLTLNPSPG